MQPLLTPVFDNIISRQAAAQDVGRRLTHITRQHNLTFAAIEGEQEFALNNNTVINRHGTVDR